MQASEFCTKKLQRIDTMNQDEVELVDQNIIRTLQIFCDKDYQKEQLAKEVLFDIGDELKWENDSFNRKEQEHKKETIEDRIEHLINEKEFIFEPKPGYITHHDGWRK